jgi:O-antigen ligase
MPHSKWLLASDGTPIDWGRREDDRRVSATSSAEYALHHAASQSDDGDSRRAREAHVSRTTASSRTADQPLRLRQRPELREWLAAGTAAGTAVVLTFSSWETALTTAALPLLIWLARARWDWVIWALTLEMMLGGWGHTMMIEGLPVRHALLALTMGVWLVNKVVDRSWRLEGGQFAWAFAGFIAFAAIVVLMSVARRHPSAIEDGMTPLFLLLLLPFCDIAVRPGGTRWLLRCFLLSVLVLAVVQIALTIAIGVGVIDPNWLAIVFYERLGGVTPQGGPFWRVFLVGSIYFQVAILLLVAVWLGQSTILGPMWDRLVLLAVTLSLLFTYTRGFWLTMLAGLCVLVTLTTPRGRLRLLAAVLVAVPVLLVLMQAADLSFVDVFVRRFARLFDPDRDTSVALRLDLYPRLWARIIERPVFGYGYGLPVENQLYYENSYLYYLVKFGFVGLTAVIWSWIAPLIASVRMARRHIDSNGRAIGAGVAASLVSMLLVTAINPFINSALGMYFLALACAVLWGWMQPQAADLWAGTAPDHQVGSRSS